MTRLTEALERARATADNSVPRVSRFEEGHHSAARDLPAAWRLDRETEDVVEDRAGRAAVPDTWQIGDDGARSEGASPESAVAPAAAPGEGLSSAESLEASEDAELHEVRSVESGIVVDLVEDFGVLEQYRRLAAALHHAQLETGARKVMVTSAVESEGKTLTATNLALTLSQSYQRRALLVDADLRRPSIHHLLKLDNRVGLSDTLKQFATGGQLPVQRVSPTLWVMSAGAPNPDPMSGLVSDVMKQFLVEATEQFDWIVIDTPPIGLLPDANLLAAMVDLAVLVVSAGTTPYALVTRAIDAIGQQRILGVVLNRADEREGNMGHSYLSYSYSPSTQKKRPRRRFRFGFSRNS